MASTGLFTYFTFKPLIEEFFRFYLIGFDLATYFNEFTINMILLDLDYTKILVMGAVTVMGIITFILSHRMSREKIWKHGFKPLILFGMFYFIFLGYMWLGTLARMAFGKKKKW